MRIHLNSLKYFNPIKCGEIREESDICGEVYAARLWSRRVFSRKALYPIRLTTSWGVSFLHLHFLGSLRAPLKPRDPRIRLKVAAGISRLAYTGVTSGFFHWLARAYRTATSWRSLGSGWRDMMQKGAYTEIPTLMNISTILSKQTTRLYKSHSRTFTKKRKSESSKTLILFLAHQNHCTHGKQWRTQVITYSFLWFLVLYYFINLMILLF